jgi:prepilin-type N-terminal cleavage/methylation domain-containing protein
MSPRFYSKMHYTGFTLIEIIVVVAITALLGVAVSTFFIDTFSLQRIISGNLSASGDARRALKTMTAEIRTASPSSLGTYALSDAATSTFTFYSNIDDDAVKERVRYFIDAGDLKKAVLKPTGNPLAYDGAEAMSTLVHDIQNGTSSLFLYYDETYTGTTTPLAAGFDITDVRLVRIDIGIDSDPNKPPSARWYTTQVSFRNLKDNL